MAPPSLLALRGLQCSASFAKARLLKDANLLPTVVKKPRREEVPAGACLCAFCGAKCCRYFALPIDTPTDWADFDSIRWFLFHDRAAVFIEKGDWYLLVYTPCKHLREDNLCGIYHQRPQICRDYDTGDCEYEDDWVYDHYFETSEQVEEYAEAVLGPRDGRSLRSPKPTENGFGNPGPGRGSSRSRIRRPLRRRPANRNGKPSPLRT